MYLLIFIIAIFPSAFQNKPECILEAFVGLISDLVISHGMYSFLLSLVSVSLQHPTFMFPALLFFQTLNFASLYFYLYLHCSVMSCH